MLNTYVVKFKTDDGFRHGKGDGCSLPCFEAGFITADSDSGCYIVDKRDREGFFEITAIVVGGTNTHTV